MRRIIDVFLGLALFLCLAGCKDKSKSTRPDMDALKSAEVGSYIYFGEYEQDNDESTGKEAIEWLVLDKQEDKMLVISRYGLDGQPYHTEYDKITWENSPLRAWLNESFYDTAFIPEEKNVILASTVTADDNSYSGASAGNDTTDKMFLLSIDEANRYFVDEAARMCEVTPYCQAQGPRGIKNGYCWWWLRTPGQYTFYAAAVATTGYVETSGRNVDKSYTVRPAMWIDLNP